jgi:hypothetical protein
MTIVVVSSSTQIIGTPVLDHSTIASYNTFAADFAAQWQDDQPEASDLHDIVQRYFKPGRTIDVGCGSGRDTAWLKQHGFAAEGVDASSAPHGVLYLSWRVTDREDQRDARGCLYSAFSVDAVRDALGDVAIQLDSRETSASSGKVVHRIVASAS